MKFKKYGHIKKYSKGQNQLTCQSGLGKSCMSLPYIKNCRQLIVAEKRLNSILLVMNTMIGYAIMNHQPETMRNTKRTRWLYLHTLVFTLMCKWQ